MRLSILILLSLIFVHASFSQEHEACIENQDALLALDYTSFDMDMDKGWRAIAAREECRLAAADLIGAYHAKLREKGAPVFLKTDELAMTFPQNEAVPPTVTISENGVVPILYWHEGQLRAFAGQYGKASALFRQSLKPKEQSHGGWNEYVLGSIAFLEGDFAALQENRDWLEANFPNVSNLRALNRMITCFGEPYSKAYGSVECQR